MIVNGYKIEPGADLQGADLSSANLQKADLRFANLSGANLEWASLRGADLRGADLRGANLKKAFLKNANLIDANLENAVLKNANLESADLINADLRGANLINAYLTCADLRGANLEKADLNNAYLHSAELKGANLKNANLKNANISNAHLKYANLEGALFGDPPFSELSAFLEKINFPFGSELAGGADEEMLSTRLQEIEALALRLSGLPKKATPGDTVANILDRRPEYTTEIMDGVCALLDELGEPDRESNPKTATRTDEPLWKYIVQEVTKSSKGGKPGQWSARKAQLCVKIYKEAGGGYVGKKTRDNALTKWTKEDWRTKSGKASLKTGERYLPAKAIESLTEEEYAETTRAKRAGLKRGQQFVPQPKKIAKKTAKFRRPR